jgi:GNAT superfamily N-acetyltransferase
VDLKLEQVTWEVGAPLDGAALAELFSLTWHGPPPRGGVLARSLCWVSAQLNGELIGFVNVAWDGGSHAFLLDPTVHPKHQRRGLGVALVQRAADEVRRRGIEWLSVDFEPHLSEFYRRCGFRPSTAGVMHLNPPASTPLPEA